MPTAPLGNLAVVLFAYDEKGNLLQLLRRIHITIKYETSITKLQYALCVQGTDGTMEEAKRFAEEVKSDASVHIYHSEKPLGVRGACVRAFEEVHGIPEAYLTMDCDLNHQPEELPGLFDRFDRDTIVVGSRFCPGGRIVGMPTWKYLLSTLFNRVSATLLGVSVYDKTSGYRLIPAGNIVEIAQQVEGSGFDFYIEFLLRLLATGLKVAEVPITFLVRTAGVSKMRIGRTTMDYIRLIRRLPRISTSARRKES